MVRSLVKNFSNSILIVFLFSITWLYASIDDLYLDHTISNTNFTFFQKGQNDHTQTYNQNRLRFDIYASYQQLMEIKAIGDVSSFVDPALLSSQEFAALKNYQADIPMDPDHVIIDEENLFLQSSWYRLYSTIYYPYGRINFGLQRIPLGVGKIWNPTDIINPANPLSVEPGERIGSYGSRLTYALGTLSEIQYFHTLDSDNYKQDVGGKIVFNVGSYDLAVSTIDNPQVNMLGLNFDGEIFETGIGFRSEYGSFYEEQKEYIRYIVGMDYAFANSLYIIMEYCHNGDGQNSLTDYDLLALQQSVTSWSQLAVNYLGLTASYQLTMLDTLNYSQINNLDDGSFFSSPSISHSLSNNSAVSFGASLFNGQNYSEFWYYDDLYYCYLEIFW
jgi:hypothetical protein